MPMHWTASKSDGSKETKPSESKSTAVIKKVAKKNNDSINALSVNIPEAIVDIKVSQSDQPIESELSRNGYMKLIVESQEAQVPKKGNSKQSAPAVVSTFSNNFSIWTWKRNQGTCSGRLRPIVDVILESSGLSTELVISGYTCDPVSINGQWWV